MTSFPLETYCREMPRTIFVACNFVPCPEGTIVNDSDGGMNGRTRIYLKNISTFRAGENRVLYIKRGIAPFGFQILIRRRRLIALNLNPFLRHCNCNSNMCQNLIALYCGICIGTKKDAFPREIC